VTKQTRQSGLPLAIKQRAEVAARLGAPVSVPNHATPGGLAIDSGSPTSKSLMGDDTNKEEDPRPRTNDSTWWHGKKNPSIGLVDQVHSLTNHFFDNEGGEWPSKEFMEENRERKDDEDWWHGLRLTRCITSGFDISTGHYFSICGREFPTPEVCRESNMVRMKTKYEAAKKAMDDLAGPAKKSQANKKTNGTKVS